MGLQRVGHDWATELNWTDTHYLVIIYNGIQLAKILPLGIYPRNKKICVQKKTCTRMFLTALAIVAHNWKQGKGSLTGERMNYSGICKNEMLSSVQSLRRVWLFATSWITARQASLSITNSRSSLRLTSIVSDAIQPSHPLSSPSPPASQSLPASGSFQWVNTSHEVAKILEFQLQHQSLKWIPRTDLF